jgi:hypothetical protein
MADKKKGLIVTGPSGKRPGAKPPASKTPAKSTSKDKGKAKDPYAKAKADALAAEKRAVARANADKKAAGKRFLEGATNLEKQAQAIRQALDVDFASARDNNLADIDRVLGQQISQLKLGATQRGVEFLKAGEDNEKATAGVAERGFQNLVRERQDSMTALLEQGAGETDTMRAMLMSARNWSANASEANRAYFDTARSINQGITDLNVDTRTEMGKMYGGAEADKERTWQDFYNRRSEAFTQLGNIKGQQADYYAQAKEMGVKPKKGTEKAAEDAMAKAFKDSAVEAGKSYTNQGLPTWVQDYQAQDQIKAEQSNSNLAAALTLNPTAKAEGATLRKWAA